MEKENLNRNRIAAVRFTAAEYNLLVKRFKATTCRQMSEYLRKCLLNKPITVNYRNESTDEVMLEIIRLRKDLNGIANNFNQSVKKLHTQRQVPEFRNWIVDTENQRSELLEKVEIIQHCIEKAAGKWLQ
ncbi:plasmid mobilization protein [Flavobacterium notoginsengisoli]|uniref:plasmid mobilization protein n=1 Tax=Flavobacterium notoginsengisoli TaxID=1478199 RepID=UPI00363F1E25